MATRRETVEYLERGEGCLGRAAPSEEVFVLRAQDSSSGAVVRYWAELNRRTLSPEKYDEALRVAQRMEKWPNRRSPT